MLIYTPANIKLMENFPKFHECRLKQPHKEDIKRRLCRLDPSISPYSHLCADGERWVFRTETTGSLIYLNNLFCQSWSEYPIVHRVSCSQIYLRWSILSNDGHKIILWKTAHKMIFWSAIHKMIFWSDIHTMIFWNAIHKIMVWISNSPPMS